MKLPPEYYSLLQNIENVADKFILKKYGSNTLTKLKVDEEGFIGLFRDDIYKELLNDEEIKTNDELRFSLYIKIAKSAAKEVDIQKGINFLLRANTLCPNSPVVLFQLAVAFESEGEAQEAIKYYNDILNKKIMDSKSFNTFIQKQIKRVEAKGPRTKPPHPGIKYMISGF